MLWVYDNYKYFTFAARGPILDVRIWRLKSVPALKGHERLVIPNKPMCDYRSLHNAYNKISLEDDFIITSINDIHTQHLIQYWKVSKSDDKWHDISITFKNNLSVAWNNECI